MGRGALLGPVATLVLCCCEAEASFEQVAERSLRRQVQAPVVCHHGRRRLLLLLRWPLL